MKKKTYHSAKTGKFVSKEFMEKNPDTTVVVTNTDIRKELIDFSMKSNNLSKEEAELQVDKYLEQK